eukprot:4492386-Pleurochrysis_carterae.AAC.1
MPSRAELDAASLVRAESEALSVAETCTRVHGQSRARRWPISEENESESRAVCGPEKNKQWRARVESWRARVD